MATVRSRSTDRVPRNNPGTSTTRKLQEALYTHLDDLEKGAFIDALSTYGTQRDIFELVNALKKILNTPVKRELFPLVRNVLRQGDVEAFDLLTRGDKHANTLPRPFLYRPHIADLNVLKKQWSATISGGRSRGATPQPQPVPQDTKSGSAASRQRSGRQKPTLTVHRSSTGRDDKHKTLSQRSSRHDIEGEIFQIDLGEPESEDSGFGFTIRGGFEMGLGVYVSSVDNGSLAQKRGLTTGDLVMEVNNISFRTIAHQEAVNIIQAATKLQLVVSRQGRVPGTHTVVESYTWTDPRGRPVSPPPAPGRLGQGEEDGRGRSGTLMLQGSDERKVNVVVQKGHGLGVMIRGGKEYGLGIYVSGIDPFSIAENAGLKLGDQILDVNGRSFLDMTHADAVNHLKRGRHLIITVKDVGKIPFAKTTIDETGWIESTKVNSYARSVSSRLSISGSITDQDVEQDVSQGANAQFALATPRGNEENWRIHEQATILLNQSEQTTLNYYLSEYEKHTINVQGFTNAMFELLNTPAKLTMLPTFKTIMSSKDGELFDQLVKNKTKEKSLKEARSMLPPDVMSLSSYDSDDVRGHERDKRTMFSQENAQPEGQNWMELLDFDEEADLRPFNFNLLGASARLSRSTPSLSQTSHQENPRRSRSRARPRSRSRPRSKSRSMSPTRARDMLMAKAEAQSESGQFTDHQKQVVRVVTQADVHSPKSRPDDPSDDSGVEINGHVINGATSAPAGEYRPRYVPNKPVRSQGVGTKGLSSPQRKILNHLQNREAMLENETLVLPNNSYNKNNIASERLQTRVPQYVTSPNSQIKTTMPRSTLSQMGPYHNGDASRNGHRDHDHSGPYLPFQNENFLTVPDEEESPREDSSAEHSPQNKYVGYARHSRSLNRTEAMKPARRGRSLTRNDGTLQTSHKPQHDSSSSSTVVHSSNTSSTLTINGRAMPAELTTTEHLLKGGGEGEGERGGGGGRSKPHTSPDVTNNALTFPSPPQRLRSRSRSADRRRQPAKISRSRSPQPRRRQLPSVETIFVTEGGGGDKPLSPELTSPQNVTKNSKGPDYKGNASRQTLHNQSPRSSDTSSTSQRPDGGSGRGEPHSGASLSLTRGKQVHSSRVSVPLLRPSKILSSQTASTRHAMSHRGNHVIAERGQSTANQSDDVYALPQKSVDRAKNKRVTISEHPVDIDTALNKHDGITTTTTISTADDSNKGTNINNIAVIDVEKVTRPMSAVEAVKKKATEKYGEIPLDVVYIYRSKPTLGVAIEGGANTRQPLPKVINVQPGGSAYESGGLKVGHIILEVNGQPAVGLSHMDAAKLIAEAFKNKGKTRMELLVTEWSERLLDTIKVDVGLLKV